MYQVQCMNTGCFKPNNVPTGKRHGHNVWDANTKLATAMIHAGIGERQVNSILGALNVPTVSHRMLDMRQREVGLAMEAVAEQSIEESLQEEVDASYVKTGERKVVGSVDAGWQKRGSGNAYNSLSGHCSMIGKETGKIIGFEVRSKSCRVCDSAQASKSVAEPHDCRKNWEGSSKAMEQDMVMSIVVKNREKGVGTSAIIGDDDTSTISLLHAQVDSSIEKISDRNHVKKVIGNSLYSLKKQHKKLSTKVIGYVQKCLNYILAQNKGDPVGIESGLNAMSKHPFGDHSDCDKSWCTFIDNPSGRFKSLPYGKPLKDKSLQMDLASLFCKLQNHSSKLANLGSTQSNESFNKTVASKAPKSHHYSGSASLNYRVAASVSQKNIGQQYLLDINKRVGLSPGSYTQRITTLRDTQARKRKAITITRRAKLRRIQLKALRFQSTSTSETREGTTYSSGIALKENPIVNESIPPPVSPPVTEHLPRDNLLGQNFVYFDLEATGFERTSHITQIAAMKQDGSSFSCFVLPKISISSRASDVTGIQLRNGKLYHQGKQMNALSISSALDNFLKYLQVDNKNQIILIGHNVKSYDCPILLNAIQACEKVPIFQEKVSGFVDTLKLIKLLKPGLPSYSQSNLVSMFLNKTYNAHDAREDVSSLIDLVRSFGDGITHQTFESSFTVISAFDSLDLSKRIAENLPSLKPLVEKHVVSHAMARKIAGSGLQFRHLCLAYRRGGSDGIRSVFEETCETSFTRVTKSSKIIDSVVNYFDTMEE